MRFATASFRCGTLFDIPAKLSLRTKLTDQMGQSSFWDNQEKARQVIQSLKPLNALLKPYEELQTTAGDLQELTELCEEDGSLEGELDGELRKAERRLDEFQLQAMLSGAQDGSNAFVRIQAGAGGTEACDWAQMLMRMFI